MTASKRKKDSNPLLKMDLSKLYLSLYENSLACIYVNDLDGHFLDGNQKSLDLLGYTRKDIRKLNFASLLSDDDLKKAFKILKEVIRTGRQNKVEEFALRRKDGTFAPVNTITSLIYQDGEPIALHGISVDISRQKSIESALRSSEKKHRAMMNHAPDAILIADMNGNIIDSNPKARELFEYSKKEFSGLHFLKLHPREDKKKVKEAFSRIINQKIYRISDVHIQTKDGRIIDVDINGTHIELEDQILVVGIFREMTEYREKQEQLKASQKDLEARVAERTMKLMEANTALKVLLSQRDNEKSENEKILLANLQAKVLSYFQELKKGPMSARQKDHIQLIEKNLQNIMTEFLTRLQTSGSKLTPKENQVASLVREGMGTKEIAKLMNVSTKTVDIFRYNIRMKLGLNNRRLSLRSYLLPL